MEWTGLNELREKFLSFYEKKMHKRLSSFPLVPIDDNSLLLINSGMAPLKKYFLGQATPPSKRVTTCQKCIRTPDIERVGKTSRHGTFFEMLGNFSFGDYFKHEATKWAWEFITEELKIPTDRIWVSVFETDDEAIDIWVNEVGVARDRIVKLGREDNFWEIGSGPCGPCSEIYFDRGEENGCGKPDCAVGCDCDRYVEFWNLVFSQYNSDGNGNYTPMEHPNIDTGMGLERLACIMQGVSNLFEVDTVQNIMKHICRISGVTYKKDEKTDISLRIITDHIRSTVFMISDGVIPSNEGRGYVLRRLLRRAACHGKLLGIEGGFLSEVCDTVINENKTAYPELVEKADYIKKIIKVEEESFAKTIDKGMELVNSLIEKQLSAKETTFPGDAAFKLYDTYGFPIDLTREIVSEKGLAVDEEAFSALMQEQRAKARAARENLDVLGWVDNEIEGISDITTTFCGYDNLECECSVKAIIKDGQSVNEAVEGDEVSLLLDAVPFYAESGGQVADTGVILASGVSADILSAKKDKSGKIFCSAKVIEGTLVKNATVTAKVDSERRSAIARNHTCAHLLQSALIKVLGNHVHQAGQLVNDKRLRFDFSHFSPVTKDELVKIENEVNGAILSALYVQVKEMSLDEAKKSGAMALFSEKYSDTVRVVTAGDFSSELCGGTHVTNTSEIGLFKIVSEASVASGIRRIEAVTGANLLDYLNSTLSLIDNAAQALKIANSQELVSKITALSDELKAKEKELDALNRKMAAEQSGNLTDNKVEINGFNVICAKLQNVKPDAMRELSDSMRDSDPLCICVLASDDGVKGNICVACGKEAVKLGAHAGNLARAAAQAAGGSGGGRPDSAMAGFKDLSNVDACFEAAKAAIEAIAKK